jgi:hypothetical protein
MSKYVGGGRGKFGAVGKGGRGGSSQRYVQNSGQSTRNTLDDMSDVEGSGEKEQRVWEVMPKASLKL